MKRFANKSLAGVTLLEIMLVLAIAAMIIVMSVKYYQNASSSQSTNAALQAIQSITAAADGIAQGTGTYTSATAANVVKIAGSSALNLPWGSSITITPSAGSYVVSLPNTPVNVCNSLIFKLKANTHYTSVTSACAGVATFSYNYVP
jgi:type II secretory pathway pseudopilin PulG